MDGPKARFRLPGIIATLLALVVVSCGTRVSRSDPQAAGGVGSRPVAASTGDLPSGQAASSDVGRLATDGAAPPASSGVPAVAGAGATPAAGQVSGSRAPEHPAGSQKPGGREPLTQAGGNPTSPKPGGAAPPTTAGRPGGATNGTLHGSGPGSPIVIGSVGNYSGPAGTVMVQGLQAVQVWARSINSQGGIHNHPVQLIVVDDGSDPARHMAAVRDLVETKRVVAFVGQYAVLTHDGAVKYLTDKRVPVIGGEGGHPAWWSSPMYFPQMAAHDNYIWVALKTAAQRFKARKLAVMTCREAPACGEVYRWSAEFGPQHGFEVVYRAQSSLAQPDFTAECLAARNAGAQAVMIAMDVNSVRRIAASCSRQGYHPEYLLEGTQDESYLKVPDFNGALNPTHALPYFLDVPETGAFRAAMSRFAPGVVPTGFSATGWVAAKLFEKVAGGISGSIDSKTILEGLWKLKDETIGGLTSPLSFVRDQPSPRARCIFSVLIEDGKWAAPDGLTPTCRAS